MHRLTLADNAASALTSWRAGIADYLLLADSNGIALLAVDEPTEDDARARAGGHD